MQPDKKSYFAIRTPQLCGVALEFAIRNRTADGIVVIPPRVSDREPESMSGITISNVICNSSTAITVAGYLKDSVIANVVNRNPRTTALHVARENGTENVVTSNIVNAVR